jgi:hypothetical protein
VVQSTVPLVQVDGAARARSLCEILGQAPLGLDALALGHDARPERAGGVRETSSAMGPSQPQLPEPEDLHHERRISNHVRRNGVVAESVNPGIARAQRQYALDHPRPKVGE